MVFSSIVFVCAFLPALFVIYTLVPSLRWKNIILTAASLLFYAFGEPVFVFVMILSVLLNYLLALRIAAVQKYKKVFLAAAVIWNLGLLGIFKYAGFLLEIIGSLLRIRLALPVIFLPLLGKTVIGGRLPIGISFFTFQILSYVVDVYREPKLAERSFGKVLLYISFFPQLIAGPIVKYHDIREYISCRHQSPEEISAGIRRFVVGLSKKLFLANTVGAVAAPVFSADPTQLSMPLAWLGAVCYTLQIYFDFSGYSDMAIGMGHMFGFTILENFTLPYTAGGMKEFWRRWHISLSTWFREYLYIPLGGNRKGRIRTMINKLIVFFCTGLWHGASWNFILWGMIHGLSMVVEDGLCLTDRLKKRGLQILGHLYTMLIVILAFVLFNAETLPHAAGMIRMMFTGPLTAQGSVPIWESLLTPWQISMILLAAVLSLLPEKIWERREAGAAPGTQSSLMQGLGYAVSLLLLFLCLLNLANASFNPFIYFRF